MKYKLYLAGPDVFRPDAVAYGRHLKQVCDKYGAEGLYPLDNEIEPVTTMDGMDPKFATGIEIFKANRAMISQCDAVVANISPFRGPSADVGTVWEMGYAAGLGKPVIAYTSDSRMYREKVVGQIPHDGMVVEDFQMFDNLMIIGGSEGIYYGANEAIKFTVEFLKLRMIKH